MKIKKTGIVIDTNLWISFLITKDFIKLDTLFKKKDIQILFSKELIEEFLEVARRPKFQKYFSESDIEKLLLSFDSIGKYIQITSDFKECRDFKDNFLLNLAADGKAKFLITGDKDLLTLAKIVTLK
jgi:putative PIN family toxin of toxin-antitoxin system